MSEENDNKSVVIAVFNFTPETGDIDMQIHTQAGFTELAAMHDMLGSELRTRAFMTVADVVNRLDRLEQISTANAKGLAALLRAHKDAATRQVDELKAEIDELSK
jgi:hypothetical protein